MATAYFDAPPNTNQTLMDYVCHNAMYLSQEEVLERTGVVDELEKCLVSWVDHLASQQELSRPEGSGSRILTFGSFSLGLSTRDSDIDGICITPGFVTREDYFSSFLELLNRHAAVTGTRAITGARVPLIEVQYGNIQVDLLFCQVQRDTVPAVTELHTLDILRCLDQASLYSINGIRETELILTLVPDANLFKKAAKCIKFWAKCQGIHHASRGFLGGFSWCLLVARVCQMCPNVGLVKLIQEFFEIYMRWDWTMPVLLKPLGEDVLKLKAWNSRVHHSDSLHRMPIIAPAYPEHNVAFSVTQSTRAILQESFMQGHSVMQRILNKEAGWPELFQRAPFSTKYKHFLAVTAKASSKDEHRDWSGLVEAKLRNLVQLLEKQPQIERVHPHTRTFSVQGSDGCSSRWLMGLTFVKAQGLNIDLAADIDSFIKTVSRYSETCLERPHVRAVALDRWSLFTVNDSAAERQILKRGMKVNVAHIKRKQLDQYVSREDLDTG